MDSPHDSAARLLELLRSYGKRIAELECVVSELKLEHVSLKSLAAGGLNKAPPLPASLRTTPPVKVTYSIKHLKQMRPAPTKMRVHATLKFDNDGDGNALGLKQRRPKKKESTSTSSLLHTRSNSSSLPPSNGARRERKPTSAQDEGTLTVYLVD